MYTIHAPHAQAKKIGTRKEYGDVYTKAVIQRTISSRRYLKTFMGINNPLRSQVMIHLLHQNNGDA